MFGTTIECTLDIGNITNKLWDGYRNIEGLIANQPGYLSIHPRVTQDQRQVILPTGIMVHHAILQDKFSKMILVKADGSSVHSAPKMKRNI